MIQYNNSLISVAEIRELSVLKPWKSILVILLEWLLIVACIVLHKLFPFIFVYVLVWFIISTRLYAMYSLIHEAIHYSITRNKMLNDTIAQLFLGFPLLISLQAMRKTHLAHHKYLQTENDPEMKHLEYTEFQFPKTNRQLVQLLLLDVSGINFVYYKLVKLLNLIIHFNKSRLTDVSDILIFTGVIGNAFYFNFAADLFLYWLIPYATFYQVLNRIRLSTEHFNIDKNNSFKTRSVIPSFLERCIFTPYNLGYHLEHHLYPGIPFYNLPEVHHKLIKHPAYMENAVIQTSYIHVLKDFKK